MTDGPSFFAAEAAGQACGICGVEPCACPEEAAAIAALQPALGAMAATAATMHRPEAASLGHAPGMPAAPYQAADAFLERRFELEAAHGEASCCHPSRPPLCALIDAGDRLNLVKSLIRGGDRAELERARLHVATVGAMMATLWEGLSAELAVRPQAAREGA